MMPNLVPKNEGNDGPSGSGPPTSTTYQDKIRDQREEIEKLRTELADLKFDRDIYFDKCRSLAQENSKQKEVIAEQKKEIRSLKAWSP